MRSTQPSCKTKNLWSLPVRRTEGQERAMELYALTPCLLDDPQEDQRGCHRPGLASAALVEFSEWTGAASREPDC
jgi:hypothetical protein